MYMDSLYILKIDTLCHANTFPCSISVTISCVDFLKIVFEREGFIYHTGTPADVETVYLCHTGLHMNIFVLFYPCRFVLTIRLEPCVLALT